MHTTRVAALLLAGAALTLCPASARAASEEERIEHLNKKAMEDYDSLELDSAKKTLIDAITRLRAAGLDQTPLAAKTHINLGIVYIAGFHDRGRGQQQFEKALLIDPSLKLDPAVATPELQAAWDAAVRAVARKRKGGPSAEPRPAQEPPRSSVSSAVPQPSPPPPTEVLIHVPPDEAVAGQRVSIYARPTVSIARATLFYRVPGQERYAQTTMGRSRKQPGDIVGQIPAEVVVGRSLQYYIEVYDAAGTVIGRQGSADSPFVLSIVGGSTAPPRADDEDPLAEARREEAARTGPRPFRERIYFDLGLGTAGAIIGPGTTTEVAWYYDSKSRLYEQVRAFSGGFIWAGLGIRAEVGAYVWRGLTVGVSGRFEAYLNHNADSSLHAERNCMTGGGQPIPCYTTTSMGNFGVIVLGKLRYQFRRHSIFRPYVHFNIGGGEWRGALNIDGSKPMSGGMIDTRSALQPTDVCSATYNGRTDEMRDPENCKGPSPGYNFQNPKPGPTDNLNLNRVCPAEGPCIDAVLMGRAVLGGGGGFYLGGKHVGLTADLSLLAIFGGAQFGFLTELYLGPQFVF